MAHEPESSAKAALAGILELWKFFFAFAGAAVAIAAVVIPRLPLGKVNVPYPPEAVGLVTVSVVLILSTIGSLLFTMIFLAYWAHKNHLAFDRIMKQIKEEHIYLSQVVRGTWGPYLLNWEKSSQYELHARQVLCVTRDLVWAVKQIDTILDDAEKNLDHTYCYIVFDDGERASAARVNAEKIRAKVLARHLENTGKRLAERVGVQFLRNHRGLTGPLASPPALPLPSDIVLYEETCESESSPKETFLVINTHSIVYDNIETHLHKFDLRLTEESMWRTFEIWFKRTWRELDGFAIH